MDRKNPYFNQVSLLVRVLPLLQRYPCFALKGGTAINLFERDMPRLSVDIDLVYLPIKPRQQSLHEITEALSALSEDIKRMMPFVEIQYSTLVASEAVTRLVVKEDRAIIKIELSPVLRGTVFPSKIRRISPKAENEFGFAEVQIVSFEDLYAGKIVAALDRQHPRDLFDIKYLLDRGEFTTSVKEAFLVYLISHNRRILEILNPNHSDISFIFEREFQGMTIEPVALGELIQTRDDLVQSVNSALTQRDKEFLIGFKEGRPDWAYFSIPHVKDFPAVRWKQHNLTLIDQKKKDQMISELKEFLF